MSAAGGSSKTTSKSTIYSSRVSGFKLALIRALWFELETKYLLPTLLHNYCKLTEFAIHRVAAPDTRWWGELCREVRAQKEGVRELREKRRGP